MSSVNLPLPEIPKDGDDKNNNYRASTLNELAAEMDNEPTSPPEPKQEEDSDGEDFDFELTDKPIWDMFQLIPRDRISPSENFEGMLKGLRVFMYVFLFLAVWITSTASVGCFLLLVGAASRAHAQVSTNSI